MKILRTEKPLLKLFAWALPAFAILAFIAPLGTNAAPLGTAFNYQGRLDQNGQPTTNGLYGLQFALYDLASGGNFLGTNLLAVPVTNGLFTTSLDFGAAAFTGDALWLEVGVNTNPAPAIPRFQILLPRTRLAPTPNAIFASTAGTVSPSAVTAAGIQNSTITAAKVAANEVVKSLNGLKDNVSLVAGTNITLTPNGNTVIIASSGVGGSGIWSALNNNTYYNAGNVGIGTSDPTTQLHVQGDLTLDPIGHPGIFTGTGFLELNRYLVLLNSVNSPTASGLKAGGVLVADSYGYANPGKNDLIVKGNVGIGTVASSFKLDVLSSAGTAIFGKTTASGGYAVWGDSPNGGGVYGSSSSGFGVYGSSVSGFGVEGHSSNDKGIYGTSAGAGPSIAGVWGENSAAGGTAVKGYKTGPGGYAVWGDSPDGGGVYGSSSSGFGVYGSSASAAGVEGHSGSGFGVYGSSASAAGVEGHSSSGFGVYGKSDSGEAGHFEGNVFVSLNASVCSLTIRGGCDVAEPFPMSGKEIPKGAVVVIDADHAGQLRLSDRAYDQRVAGIVSGANGINPGIALHQEGALEGGQNVALSGRVYVLAEASNSPIQPGDLLTTSSVAGHAMKVTDHTKAQGAIIGKAMSALKEGTGMVLVLVTLQ